MKKLFLVISIFTIILDSSFLALAQQQELRGTISLSGAWAVYPTAVAWAEGFKKLHPRVNIDISAGGAGKGVADAIAGLIDIGMVSRDPDPSELNKGITAIYILKDAVYPVVSDKNFFLEDLLKKGIKKQIFSDIYVTGTAASWNQAVKVKKNKPIHVYTRSDSSGAAASWAAYLGKKQEDLKGVGVYGDPGLLAAVKNDPAGIGYNNFSYVFMPEGGLIPGIRLIPIDANENGIADADEVYDTKEKAIAAISAGRYPAARKNYFFVKGKPSALVKAFIQFALSEEGTKIAAGVGTSLPIPAKEREEILKTLE